MKKYIKVTFVVTFNFIFFITSSFASNREDCRNSSFYVKNIKVDFTKSSIVEARYLAEEKARTIGFKRLIRRLTFINKKLSFDKSILLQLVDFLKINSEANSNKRYIANFNVCFNRDSVIDFFHRNKLKYAETIRKPISILPLFKGPRGFIIWDKRDLWYSAWKTKINLSDGLVVLNLAEGNLYLNRRINSNIINKPNETLIKELIENEKTNALLFVIAEPILSDDGKSYLNTYTKLFNKFGAFKNVTYRNKISLKSASSVYSINERIIHDEVSNIIESIQIAWKKSNVIDTSIVNQVDLLIPITKNISTILKSDLIFNDKIIEVRSTKGFSNQGIIKINKEFIFYKEKKSQSFENLTRSLLDSKKNIKYSANAKVIQKNINIWPFVLKSLNSLPFVTEVKVISLSNSSGRIIVKFIGNKKTFFQALNEKKMIFKDFNNQQYILNINSQN